MPSSECVWVMTGGVWLVSLDVHQCKNRWEITLNPNIRSLPFLPVPFNACKLFEWAPDSGDVWKLSGGVCMMSGWCLRVSGAVTILNIWGKHNFWSWYSDIGLSYNALWLVKTPMSEGTCMVSGGAWMVSVWCLDVFSGCLRLQKDWIYWVNIIFGQDTQILRFLPVPSLMHKNDYI